MSRLWPRTFGALLSLLSLFSLDMRLEDDDAYLTVSELCELLAVVFNIVCWVRRSLALFGMIWTLTLAAAGIIISYIMGALIPPRYSAWIGKLACGFYLCDNVAWLLG